MIDEAAIYILADSYNQYLKATDNVNTVGLTVPGARNSVVANPCVRIAKDNKATCLSIMQEMGLTLKSRNKMNVLENETEKTPLQNFFSNND